MVFEIGGKEGIVGKEVSEKNKEGEGRPKIKNLVYF